MAKFRSELMDILMLFSTILFFLVVYAFVSNQDYHELVDTVTPIKYNCEMLLGSWHPDFPPEVINECRKKLRNDD
jgi:hypothetical protein